MQVSTGYYILLQIITDYYRLLVVPTGYYMLLHVSKYYYRLLQVTLGYYRFLQVTTGYYSLLHFTKGCYKWLENKQFSASYSFTIYRGAPSILEAGPDHSVCYTKSDLGYISLVWPAYCVWWRCPWHHSPARSLWTCKELVNQIWRYESLGWSNKTFCKPVTWSLFALLATVTDHPIPGSHVVHPFIQGCMKDQTDSFLYQQTLVLCSVCWYSPRKICWSPGCA